MRIYNGGDDFVPEHFEIRRFYDETLLFAWQGDKVKVFRYDNPDDNVNPRLLLAPGDVKTVQNFGERIFITFHPCGVYELSKNYNFARLSSVGIGIGARFYQVIRLENNYISLGDKQSKTCRLLWKHDPVDGAAPQNIGLIKENVDIELMSVLLDGNTDHNELCILSRGYEIYKITPDKIKIIYSSLCLVTDIIEVKKNAKITCLLYITNKSMMMLMYARNNELIFEKVQMNYKVKTAYAFVDELLEDVIWIIHSDGVRTHKSRKIFCNPLVKTTELDDKNITCLRSYNSEILGLNSMGELVRVDLKTQHHSVDGKDDHFIRLKRRMLEGTDTIVEAICEKVKELQSLDTELLNQQGALKRIKMVDCKQDIPMTPELQVRKIANKTFVNCKFGYNLPEKCQLSFAIQSGGRKIFATKQVTENETTIELPVTSSMLSETLYITIHLITLADEGYSWCIVKDCIKDVGQNKTQVKMSHNDKSSFINARLAALNNLKMEDKFDIVKLNAIKNSVRKEFNVI